MIISRTPFRISFFGGGTDYPTWVQEHGGAVLSTTIDKYCYISIRPLPPFFEHKHRIVYSTIENVQQLSEIKHPAVRAVMEWFGVQQGIEVHHDGDLPARSGLGSSSSFTVGFLNALKALKGEMVSKQDLADAAIHIEQQVLREPVGSQDQVAAAFGGFNQIHFHQDGGYDVQPLILDPLKKTWLESHLMLFFTGISRYSTDIAQTKIQNLGNKQLELETMRQMVDEASGILYSRGTPIVEFGKLLHEAWMLKRQLSDKVTTPYIDEIYETARAAGAIGGKIMGAGGGGFMVFFVEPHNQDKVREQLARLIHVPFSFETGGSKIVFYQPNGLAS